MFPAINCSPCDQPLMSIAALGAIDQGNTILDDEFYTLVLKPWPLPQGT